MKFNKEELKKQGLTGMKNAELLQVIKNKMSYLVSHNKNYTKQQYYELTDINDLIQIIEA